MQAGSQGVKTRTLLSCTYLTTERSKLKLASTNMYYPVSGTYSLSGSFYVFYIKKPPVARHYSTALIPTLGRQRRVSLCKSEASLGYIVKPSLKEKLCSVRSRLWKASARRLIPRISCEYKNIVQIHWLSKNQQT